MYSDLGIDFLIRCFHFGDNFSMNYFRAFFITEEDVIPLCDCVGGHITIQEASDCVKVIKLGAYLVANRL